MTNTCIWGIHMREHVGADAIDNNYVGIGWYKIGNIFEIPAEREAYKLALKKAYPDKKKGAIPVNAGTIYKFVHKIKAGDFVVFPSKHDRMVNIGQFTDKYEYVPEQRYPNRRYVKWLGHFPRSDFSQSALSEIGSSITLFSIRKHGAEFLKKINKHIESLETDAQEELPDDDLVTSGISKQAEETTQDYVIRKIYTHLDGYEFESFIAHLLECMGYTARVTSKSGDGGVDIIAHLDKLGFQPPIIKVQCKKQMEQTGEPAINQLLGTLGKGEFALFVNLGSYSKPATVKERNRSELRLIDGEQLVELILDNYSKMSARYRTLIPLRQIYVPDIIDD